MRVGLDTSVLLRLLVGKPPDQAAAAVAFLDGLHRRGDTAVVSDLVVAQGSFALQFHYGITEGSAISAMRQLFDSGEIVPTGQAGSVLSLGGLASAKPGLVDRLVHAGYTSAADGMPTFENAGGKLTKGQILKAAQRADSPPGNPEETRR